MVLEINKSNKIQTKVDGWLQIFREDSSSSKGGLKEQEWLQQVRAQLAEL